jgi:acetoin utilization protein AcuB
MEKPEFKRLKQDLADTFDVLYWAVDSVHNVI